MRIRTGLVVASILGVSLSGVLLAQDPPPAGGPPQVQQQGPAGGRRAQQPPAVRPNAQTGDLTVDQVMMQLDGYAIVQSQQVLDLTQDQTANFVARYMRLQQLRRRLANETQRTMRELNQLLNGQEQNRDELITEKLRLFDEAQQRATQDIRKATLDLDAVLSPLQRARFRVFEQRLDFMKMDMISRARAAARGRGSAPAPQNPARRGGL